RQSLGALARKNGTHLLEYGNPFGYLPLREHLVLLLGELGIAAHPGQVLLTQGTSQALELVIRYLLKPGDAALVDDPGYYNMFGNVRLQGVEMLAVPPNPDGPKIATVEKLATGARPQRTRGHQDTHQHHDVTVHRAPHLPDAGRRPLSQISRAAARAARCGARQCRARVRRNWA